MSAIPGKDPAEVSRPQASDRSPTPKFTFRALLLYGAVWVAVTAAVAFVVISVVDGEESVTLPPVRAIELTSAAEAAGCVLRIDDRLDSSLPLSGPSRRAAEPGFYDDPLPDAAVVGALRRGIIVIHYRRDLPADRVRKLRVVQQAVPAGTIVAPNDGMRFAVAATAWQHLVGCAQWTDGTIDALRLFRGRYIGRGAGEL
jgi:hypothetical protein